MNRVMLAHFATLRNYEQKKKLFKGSKSATEPRHTQFHIEKWADSTALNRCYHCQLIKNVITIIFINLKKNVWITKRTAYEMKKKKHKWISNRRD